MSFPDLLILMAQKNQNEKSETALHSVRDLFRSYDIQKTGVINADEFKGTKVVFRSSLMFYIKAGCGHTADF